MLGVTIYHLLKHFLPPTSLTNERAQQPGEANEPLYLTYHLQPITYRLSPINFHLLPTTFQQYPSNNHQMSCPSSGVNSYLKKMFAI